MLDIIKKAIRRNHDLLDDDLQLNIDAAIDDLKRVGVVIEDNSDQDKILIKAVELYVKSQIDYHAKGVEFQKNYEKLRDALSLCAKYSGGESDV